MRDFRICCRGEGRSRQNETPEISGRPAGSEASQLEWWQRPRYDVQALLQIHSDYDRGEILCASASGETFLAKQIP